MPLLARARLAALALLAISICLCLAMPAAVETRHTADGDVYRLLGREVPSVVGKAILTAIPIMLVASAGLVLVLYAALGASRAKRTGSG